MLDRKIKNITSRADGVDNISILLISCLSLEKWCPVVPEIMRECRFFFQCNKVGKDVEFQIFFFNRFFILLRYADRILGSLVIIFFQYSKGYNTSNVCPSLNSWMLRGRLLSRSRFWSVLLWSLFIPSKWKMCSVLSV